MEGFAGIRRPRRRLLPGSGSRTRSLWLPSSGIRPPPSEGPKGGEVPQLHRPLFSLDREIGRSPCMCRAAAPWGEKAIPVTPTAPQMRLLIIEDDRESADYLVKAFREVGHVADLA